MVGRTCELLGECLNDLVDLLIRLSGESHEYGLPTINTTPYYIKTKKSEKGDPLFVNDRSHNKTMPMVHELAAPLCFASFPPQSLSTKRKSPALNIFVLLLT